MLNLQLVHDSAKALFELVDLLVELLAHLHLKLVVKFLVDRDRLVMLLNFLDHFLDKFAHLFNFWRNLDNLVLHFSVLQDTLGAKHASVVLAIKFNFLRRMDITVFN